MVKNNLSPLKSRHFPPGSAGLKLLLRDRVENFFKILSGISLEIAHRLQLSQENFGDTGLNRLFGDHPIDLGKLPVAVAAAVDLVSLDGGPSQIMVDLAAGDIVSAVVGFAFV